MNKRLWFPIFVAAAVFFPAGILRAAAQVDAGLDTTAMRIGDPLTLTLTVRTEPGQQASFPDLSTALGGFDLLSQEPPERYEDDNGSALERRSCKVTTFETGRRLIPSLPFIVSAPDGSVDTLHTEELPVIVVSLLADTTADQVRALKGLIGMPKLWHRLAWWSALALALLAVLVFLWRRYLARREARLREKFAPLDRSRPAHLVALEELDRIKSMGLIEKGEIKLFYVLVSEVIRQFLDARFGVDAPEMTTWEIDLALEEKLPRDGTLKALIVGFLETCDLVKFAKYKPSIVEINSTFNRVYEIVEQSRPEIPAEPIETQPAEQMANVGPDSQPAPDNTSGEGDKE
ncbi:MAG TPA: hypothetical protein VM123_08625 [archaeon]|nr:hypothetical protein [archaeon]